MAVDRLSDALNKIKLYERNGKKECVVERTKIIEGVLSVLKQSGYIEDYLPDEVNGRPLFRVMLKGAITDLGAIKPRHPVKYKEWVSAEAQYLPAYNVGLLVVSTSEGIVSNKDAKERRIGGRLLAFVY